MYRVVEDFEAALSSYTGAPYVVTTNSCSMALQIALKAFSPRLLTFPGRTYCSAPLAAMHAGHKVQFEDIEWRGAYVIHPLPVWDCARRFTSGMYQPGSIQCVSFQTSKILGIEQGGAILHDRAWLDEWSRRMRFDGRLNASEKVPSVAGYHCYMNPSTAAQGLARLACLPADNPDQIVDFPDLSNLEIWK